MDTCTPRHSSHLDVAISKQVLHEGPVSTSHASMVNSEAKGQQVTQLAALHCLCLSLKWQGV